MFAHQIAENPASRRRDVRMIRREKDIMDFSIILGWCITLPPPPLWGCGVVVVVVVENIDFLLIFICF